MKHLTRKITSALAGVLAVAALSVSVFAGSSTDWANYFDSHGDDVYKCSFSFIPNHKGAKGEPYTPYNRQIRQAYVSVHSENWITGSWSGYKKQYSPSGQKYMKWRLSTGTLSIDNKFGSTEYTNYGTFLF